MEYLAGNIEAVKNAMNGVANNTCGELDAVKYAVNDTVVAGKIFGCGGAVGKKALKAAATGVAPAALASLDDTPAVASDETGDTDETI